MVRRLIRGSVDLCWIETDPQRPLGRVHRWIPALASIGASHAMARRHVPSRNPCICIRRDREHAVVEQPVLLAGFAPSSPNHRPNWTGPPPLLSLPARRSTHSQLSLRTPTDHSPAIIKSTGSRLAAVGGRRAVRVRPFALVGRKRQHKQQQQPTHTQQPTAYRQAGQPNPRAATTHTTWSPTPTTASSPRPPRPRPWRRPPPRLRRITAAATPLLLLRRPR